MITVKYTKLNIVTSEYKDYSTQCNSIEQFRKQLDRWNSSETNYDVYFIISIIPEYDRILTGKY